MNELPEFKMRNHTVLLVNYKNRPLLKKLENNDMKQYELIFCNLKDPLYVNDGEKRISFLLEHTNKFIELLPQILTPDFLYDYPIFNRTQDLYTNDPIIYSKLYQLITPYFNFLNLHKKQLFYDILFLFLTVYYTTRSTLFLFSIAVPTNYEELYTTLLNQVSIILLTDIYNGPTRIPSRSVVTKYTTATYAPPTYRPPPSANKYKTLEIALMIKIKSFEKLMKPRFLSPEDKLQMRTNFLNQCRRMIEEAIPPNDHARRENLYRLCDRTLR
jgi:hypothetical protein